MLALRRTQWQVRLSAPALAAVWAVLAVAGGLAVARLSLLTTVEIMAGLVVAAAAVWEPAIGLGLALAVGVTRAYLAAARPDIPDLGQIFLGLALAGWAARSLAQRRVVIPRSGLLAVLSVYIGVSLLSLVPTLSASAELGLKEIIKWAELGAILILVASEAQRGRLRWIIAAILLAGLAQGLIGLWQYQFRGHGPDNFLILGNHYRAYGTFEQPNPFGGFLGLVWPIAAGLAWACLRRARQTRRAAPMLAAGGMAALAAVMLAALYVSFSRGAWLGAAAAGLAMVAALPRRGWLGVALVGLGLGLGWALAVNNLLPASLTARLAQVGDFINVTDVTGIDITGDNFAIVERLAHWQAAEGMVRDYPWLGVGVGNYEIAYPQYSLINWPLALGHAHMIYLNVLAETGLVGLAAYSVLWLTVLALTLRTIGRTHGLARGLAVGLLGAWVHLSAHQIVDDLYVNNIPLTIGALLGVLYVLSLTPSAGKYSANGLSPALRAGDSPLADNI
jgi:putative inorganic carbon (hco3(-)) transporter